MPGPAPTPTKLLAARGSWRASTRPNEPEPEPVTELAPPVELSGRALEVWNAIAPRLAASRVLTSADTYTLVRYAHTMALWLAVVEGLGDAPKREQILTLGKLGELLAKLEAAFGLSPADRTRIAVPEAPSTDPKERFFERRAQTA